MRFYRVIWLIFNRFLRFILRVRAEGIENMPAEGPVILCCNHRSNYDPVMLGAVLTRPLCFMAKAELFKVPLLRGLIRLLGAFPVQRGRGDIDAIKTSLRVLKSGKVLAMFPEGHRLIEGGAPRKFKSGVAMFAYKTGAVILPAAIICEGEMKPFKKKKIVIGKPFLSKDIGLTEGTPEAFREASEELRARVTAMMGA